MKDEEMKKALEKFFNDAHFSITVESGEIKKILITKRAEYELEKSMKERPVDREELEKKISDLLEKLGIPSNINGKEFLKEAIVICYIDKGAIQKLEKNVYNRIISKYSTTFVSVERGIGYAIEVATDKHTDLFDEIFCCTDSNRNKPSNSRFIARIAEWIRYQM